LLSPVLLERVWESAGDAMAVSDPNGTVIAANPAYSELYGYPLDEVVGKSFAIIFAEPDRAAAVGAYRQTFVAEEIAPIVESSVRRKDGSERMVASRYTFILEDGRRTAMLSVIRDITARKRAEAKIEEMLQREQTARRDAEMALRVRDQIVRFATHDLRNPLTSIKGYAQLLERRIRGSARAEDAPLLEGLKGIDGAASQMDALIGEMLDIARIQAGQPLQLHRQPVDLVQLVDRCIRIWQETTDRHRLRAEMQVPELVGNWDTARLERVLGNLLSNAIKYSPAGGEITAIVSRDGSEGSYWADVTIADQGQGIAAEDLPYIFEQFYRATNAASVAGTGLGLAAARTILEQHGGSIAVASREGAGTTVTARLPLD
jgi:PAS domain S-box-containing protein